MNLRGMRRDRGLTVNEVADAADVKPASLYYYERTGAMPREPGKAKALADFFGCKVTDLWPIADPERTAVAVAVTEIEPNEQAA